jgi:hypothetical protein
MVVDEGTSLDDVIQPPDVTSGEGIDDLVDQGGEDSPATGDDVNGADVPGAWEANYNFNVLEEQREIDEWARPFITDAESEAKFRDLFERAHGIDVVKEDRQQLRQHNQTLDQNLNNYTQNYQQLGSMVQNNDLDSFFKQWGIAPDKVVDFAINHVRANDPNTPPEERQQYEQQSTMQQQMASLQYQNHQMQQQLQGNTVQQTAIDLNMELAKPDISRIAEEFDTRAGQPGSFRQRVIDMGAQLSRQDPNTGQYVSPSAVEAVQKTMQFMGYNPAAMGTPQQPVHQPGQAPMQPHMQVQAPQAKPVIQTVQGAGTSPVKEGVRSIAKLRELAQAAN